MDNNPPQINIIKSSSGGGFHLPKLPKISPLVIVLTTVLLAVVTVVSVFLLYQRREVPVAAPTPAAASTTQTISDDFNAATLNTNMWNPMGTVTQENGVAHVTTGDVAAEIAGLKTISSFTGDFSMEVQALNLTNATPGFTNLCLENNSPGNILCVRWKRVNGVDAGDLYYHLNPADDITPEVQLGNNLSSVKLKLVRIGSVVQGFVDPGNGYVLVGSNFNLPVFDGAISLTTSSSITAPFVTTVDFDNFSADVNFAAVQPTPIPGSAAACALNFTVLDTVATGTPGPTATPSPTLPPGVTPTVTPTPTGTIPPTPTPTVTPTPQPTPASCNNSCTTNADCSSGLICSGNVCRNPQCTTQTNCVCLVATPTPPPGSTSTPQPTPASCNNSCTTNAQCSNDLICSNGACRNPQCIDESGCNCVVAAGPTPTPVILQTAGSMTGTLLLAVGGALILGLGAILMFVL